MRPRTSRTEVFFLPAAAHTEKDGTFTNTQRLLQWHDKAVEPPGDCALASCSSCYHLGRASREQLAARPEPQDRPILRSHLGLPDRGPARRARAPRRCCRRSTATTVPTAAGRRLHRAEGRRLDRLRLLDLLGVLRRRRQPDGAPQAGAGAELGRRSSGAGRGRRTGGCSTTAPRPTPRAGPGPSARVRVVGRGEGRWTGHDVPDFERRRSRPTTPAATAPKGMDAIGGDDRSSCRPTARAGCSRRAGS